VSINYRWGQNGCLVFAHDITQRKKTEETLRKSRESYRELIENLNEVVFSLRLDGSIEFVSPVIREMLGDDPQELVGQPFGRDIHPDDVDEVQAMLEQTLSGRQRTIHEFRVFDRSGDIHWVRASARVRWSDGKPDGVQGVLTDITEQKLAEADRERLIAAIEQSGEAIMITDPVGTIQYVNAAFETVTGYDRDETLGQTPRILKSGQHDGQFYRQMWETLLGGNVWQGRMVNRRKDGSLYTEDAAISPVRDHLGRIANFVGAARDVTEHIQQAVQLQQTQKMESIGRLAGGVAHDFNNLLSVILGYVGLALRQVAEDDPMRNHLLEIRYASERAAELTRQLLAFGRRQVLQPVAFDLNAVLTDMEKMLRRILGEDIDLRLVLDPGLGAILADPGQIEQVIMNLVINARDAMPLGGKLTIDTANVEVDDPFAAAHADLPSASYVRMAVTDTGSGMNNATLARAFEPFFSTKESGQGTGLGLPTAHGIVKQSGGDIRVYSELDRGTTFKVYLPCTQQTPMDRTEPTSETTPHGRGELVLVVEDEPALRNLLDNMLTAHGYRVILAADGIQALAIVEQQNMRPDLVLTDVIMPGMSGKVMADRLREKQPDLKVLYMSGYTDNAIVHHGVLDRASRSSTSRSAGPI
jgi:two-component system, cell cycle sensor histidine kinase and response regulator CckA